MEHKDVINKLYNHLHRQCREYDCNEVMLASAALFLDGIIQCLQSFEIDDDYLKEWFADELREIIAEVKRKIGRE